MNIIIYLNILSLLKISKQHLHITKHTSIFMCSWYVSAQVWFMFSLLDFSGLNCLCHSWIGKVANEPVIYTWLIPLYFGLDTANSVDQIQIAWPSGKKQLMLGPISTNQLIEIEESQLKEDWSMKMLCGLLVSSLFSKES